MYLMPLMSVWIAFSVPVGVGIYWIISNILSGVQSVVLFKLYNPEKYKAEYEAKLREEEEKKRLEREKRRQRKLDRGEELSDDDLDEEELKRKREQEKKARRSAARSGEEDEAARQRAEEEYLTAKEINRRRLAEARRQVVREAIDTLESGYTLDAVDVAVESVLSALLELTGEKITDAVVDQVFSHFCVGK